MSAPLKPESLVTLTEELEALVRSGVPLELGLRDVTSVPRDVRAVMQEFADRLESGQLAEVAFAELGPRLPPLYQVIVRTGLRTGRLSEVLASISADATSFVELRQSLRQAMVYPLIVVSLAYLLFCFWVPVFFRLLDDFWRDSRWPQKWWFRGARVIVNDMHWWFWIIPLVAVVITVGLSFWQRSEGVFGGWLRLVPGFNRILRDAAWARFSRVLALLVEYQVPLPEALPIAGRAANRRIAVESDRAAAALANGAPIEQSLAAFTRFPELLAWIIGRGDNSQGGPVSQLSSGLREASTLYATRCQNRAEWIKRLVPVLLLVVIGGGTALIYTVAVMGPLQAILSNLGEPLKPK